MSLLWDSMQSACLATLLEHFSDPACQLHQSQHPSEKMDGFQSKPLERGVYFNYFVNRWHKCHHYTSESHLYFNYCVICNNKSEIVSIYPNRLFYGESWKFESCIMQSCKKKGKKFSLFYNSCYFYFLSMHSFDSGFIIIFRQAIKTIVLSLQWGLFFFLIQM